MRVRKKSNMPPCPTVKRTSSGLANNIIVMAFDGGQVWVSQYRCTTAASLSAIVFLSRKPRWPNKDRFEIYCNAYWAQSGVAWARAGPGTGYMIADARRCCQRGMGEMKSLMKFACLPRPDCSILIARYCRHHPDAGFTTAERDSPSCPTAMLLLAKFFFWFSINALEWPEFRAGYLFKLYLQLYSPVQINTSPTYNRYFYGGYFWSHQPAAPVVICQYVNAHAGQRVCIVHQLHAMLTKAH